MFLFMDESGQTVIVDYGTKWLPDSRSLERPFSTLESLNKQNNFKQAVFFEMGGYDILKTFWREQNVSFRGTFHICPKSIHSILGNVQKVLIKKKKKKSQDIREVNKCFMVD